MSYNVLRIAKLNPKKVILIKRIVYMKLHINILYINYHYLRQRNKYSQKATSHSEQPRPFKFLTVSFQVMN